MGLVTGTLKDGAGQLMPNETITFYHNGTASGTVTTDAAGKYSKLLTGPLQYHAVVDAHYCTPKPMNVPVGVAVINLVKTATTYP
ncbi:MAG: hypothetical protein ABFE08_23640 [Armatimonadia bacterium]